MGKGAFSPFPTMFSKTIFLRVIERQDYVVNRQVCHLHASIWLVVLAFNPFPNEIFDAPKLKEFADDNFRFDENGR